MKIYKSESDIASLVSENKSSAVFKIKNANVISEASDRIIASHKQSASFPLINHPALLDCSAIMVSTSANKNDDFFPVQDTYNASSTVIGQPVNEEHKDTDIIGHIYGYSLLNESGNPIEPVDDDKYPEYFDLCVNFVIYKFVFPEIAEQIEKRFASREAFVSMECVFQGFDYALIKDGVANIIKRTDETSYLSKFLLAFGGSGKFNGFRICRVLRDITFVGMGNVRNPANPKSHYLSVASEGQEKEKGEIMPETVVDSTIVASQELEAMKAELTDVKAKLEASEAKAAEIAAERDARITAASDMEKRCNELTAQLAEVAGKLGVAESECKKKDEEMGKLMSQYNEIRSKLDQALAELAQEAYKKTCEARLVKLNEIGIAFTDSTEDVAKKDNLMSMSDASFNEVITYATIAFNKGTSKPTEKPVEQAPETVIASVVKDDNSDITRTAGDVVPPTTDDVAKKLVAAVRKNKQKK